MSNVAGQWSRNWPAPAKLNLMLHITGRRSSGPKAGYHELQTVFQLLCWGDVLHFRMRNDGEIQRLSGPVGVAAADDLTVRAAKLLQAEAQQPLSGVDIVIDKRLPMGGGLGGGSSNAATVLVALNKLWNCGLNSDELAALGLQLGADVPVFIRGHNAWAEGVGELLQAIELPSRWFLLLIPACHVATETVFNAEQLTRDTPISTIRAFLEQGGRNDCENVVIKSYPEVAQAIDSLAKVGKAKLTGTGACVFAEYSTLEQAMCALQQFRRDNAEISALVVKGCGSSQQTSPLLQRLEEQPAT